MKTYIYWVRHGESPKTEGNERTRGLTDKGRSNASRITGLLKDEGIDIFISSPYRRAVLTIEELARSYGKEIMVIEDLKELIFSGGDTILADKELYQAVERMFADPNFSLPGGESTTVCRNRSITILKQILSQYKGQKVVIGTHGMVMTLMMGYFDSRCDFHFLMQTSKPDIYRMAFIEDEWIETTRIWPE